MYDCLAKVAITTSRLPETTVDTGDRLDIDCDLIPVFIGIFRHYEQIVKHEM